MTIRDYLQIGRAQTAAVEGALFPLAALAGGAPLWALPLFALLGIVQHLGGFGENSVSDLRYDRADPSKADHPLVAGRVSYAGGVAFVYGLQILGAGIFVGILAYTGVTWVFPVLAFVLYHVFGHAYNWLGKLNKPAASAEIALCFAFASLAVGSAWTGRADPAVWSLFVFALALVAFQIAVAGELKEIAQSNERNLLRRLGSRVGPGLLGTASEAFGAAVEAATRGGAVVVVKREDLTEPFLLTSGGAWALAWSLTAFKIAALAWIGWVVGGPPWMGVGAAAGILLFTGYTFALLLPGPFDRPRRMRLMGLGEAASVLVVVVPLAPILGWWLWAPFLVLPFLWFAGMNRILWARTGSALAPGV